MISLLIMSIKEFAERTNGGMAIIDLFAF